MQEFDRLQALQELFEESTLAMIEAAAALRTIDEVLPALGRAFRQDGRQEHAVAVSAAVTDILSHRREFEHELLVQQHNQGVFATHITRLLDEMKA